MVKALIIAPRHDVATGAWYPWLTEWLPPRLTERGVECVILATADATRDNVWRALADPDVAVVLGVGHGNEDVFTGWRNETVFKACAYPPELLKGRNFAPVSCLVGKALLPDMVSKGLGAGLGQVTLYVFYINFQYPPLQDPYLSSFTRSEFTYALAIAAGRSHMQAHIEMRDAYLQAARRWDSIDPEVAATLAYDAVFRYAFGDPNWVLPGAPPPPPPPVEYVCPWCGYSTRSAEDMKYHVLDAHVPPCPPQPLYRCPWCGFSTNSAESMKHHVEAVHVMPSLRPCVLPFLLRKVLMCPLKR